LVEQLDSSSTRPSKPLPRKQTTWLGLKKYCSEDMEEYKEEKAVTHSVREAVQTLYDTKTGEVEASVRAHQDELTFDRFMFIDTIEMDRPYYLKNYGRQPLRMILALLPQVLDTGAATCVLSPARLERDPDRRTVEND
jgi:hypothetical protein